MWNDKSAVNKLAMWHYFATPGHRRQQITPLEASLLTACSGEPFSMRAPTQRKLPVDGF